jgi:hypothetical protein
MLENGDKVYALSRKLIARLTGLTSIRIIY